MMQARALLDGRITPAQWRMGVLFLIAGWLAWSLVSGLLFTGANGPTIAALSALVFLLPLAVLCARRLNDLERSLTPTLCLLIAPFALHTVITQITLGAGQTSLATGFENAQAQVLDPSLLGWAVIAWLLGAMAWMVVVLGIRPGVDAGNASADADAQPA